MGFSREMKWLIIQVRPFLLLHLGAIFCIVIGGVAGLLDPLLMKWLIDQVLPQRTLGLLILAAAAFLLTYSCLVVFQGLGDMLSLIATQKMLFRLRLALLRHLQKLPIAHHDKTPVGDTVYRLEQDVDQVGEFCGEIITTTFRMMTLTIVTLGIMFVLNPRLTCLVLPLVPAFVLVRRHYHSELQNCSDLVQKHSSKRSSFLYDHLSSIVQVKLLTREITEARRFAQLARNSTKAQIRQRRTELVFTLSSMLIIILGIVTVLGFGSHQVIRGSMSIGGLVAFYGYVARLFGPLEGGLVIYSKFQRVIASVRRITAITNMAPAIADAPGALALQRNTPGSTALCNVTFGYCPGKDVLQGVTLRIQPGEKVALVGASGSGKSTIAKLITRLYDLQSGAVLVDGHDVRNIKLKSLRTIVSLVLQDPILFDATVRENLLYANPKASQAELDEAEAISQLQNVIRGLPKGWDDPVGPGGGKLSRGERQRVALARALLQRPRVLILDEATSALDRLTEKRLFEELDNYVQQGTVLVISHRLPAIRWADRILVLDNGQIVEEGTHSQLFQLNGVYRRLCVEQFERENHSRQQQAIGQMPGSK